MHWFFLFICALGTSNQTKDLYLELRTIEQQISELQETQKQLQSDVEMKSNDAMRWQFQSENYLEARRAWDEIALEKQQIRELQEKIDQLEARKQELLHQHAG